MSDRARPGAAEIRAAVEAERAGVEDLLCSLVAAPTLCGNEEPGQVLMADAFAAVGLEVADVGLDPAVLGAHPLHARLDWDVSAKRNVVATWQPPDDAGGAAGRSLLLGGHVDVVPAEPDDLGAASPSSRDATGPAGCMAAAPGDMKSGLAAMVVRAARAPPPRAAAGIPAHAAQPRRGGAGRQWSPCLRAGGPVERRRVRARGADRRPSVHGAGRAAVVRRAPHRHGVAHRGEAARPLRRRAHR